jgi:hypothetical protein
MASLASHEGVMTDAEAIEALRRARSAALGIDDWSATNYYATEHAVSAIETLAKVREVLADELAPGNSISNDIESMARIRALVKP